MSSSTGPETVDPAAGLELIRIDTAACCAGALLAAGWAAHPHRTRRPLPELKSVVRMQPFLSKRLRPWRFLFLRAFADRPEDMSNHLPARASCRTRRGGLPIAMDRPAPFGRAVAERFF